MDNQIDKYLKYDETSPTGLRWIKVKGIHMDRLCNQPAGSFMCRLDGSKSGIIVGYNSNLILAHRIIWELHNGPIPEGMVIDHLDGNPWNNKIENLGCKTQTENNQNAKLRKDNSTGVKGVHYSSTRNKYGKIYFRWTAFISVKGKMKSKCFSVKKFGELGAFEKAKEWRDTEIEKLNTSGSKYTERHIVN